MASPAVIENPAFVKIMNKVESNSEMCILQVDIRK